MYLQYRSSNKGFTLVELMLAMSFIAILLMSIAMLSIYLTTLYQQGSTMKDINQAGTEIASDIKRSLADSSTTGFPKFQTYNLYGATDSRKALIICTGSISYVVNNGEALQGGNRFVRYPGGQPIRLAKVIDAGGVLCNGFTPPGFTGTVANRTLGATYSNSARELLSQESSYTLSVWGLAVSFFPNASNPELTGLKLTIGTSESGDLDFPNTVDFPGDVDSPGDYLTCRTGHGSEWCGINTFEIVGRSGNTEEL